MTPDELHAELEQIRLRIANTRYSLEGIDYPDYEEHARAHFREYETQERNLLAQLDQLASKR